MDTSKKGKANNRHVFRFKGPVRLKNSQARFTAWVLKHFKVGGEHWLIIRHVKPEKPEVW
jgi:hypothetical protein